MIFIGPMAAMVFFVAIGYWKRRTVPFLLAAGCSAFIGLYWRPYFGGNLGLVVGLCLLVFAFFCLGEGIRYLLYRER